jgi:hypothetical protein
MLHAGCRGVYEPTAVVGHWVPRERLARGYFRRWLYQNGRDVAQVERVYLRSMRRLLGVPRWLWRQAIGDMLTAITEFAHGDSATRFAAELRVLWFSGYLRQSWFGRTASIPGR